ncbi:FAD-binding oxidoreductase [Bacillus sp. FJAT-49736]|uniref:NAD(P)/FAD-dependent oxidoreductase n=1 Tax=Bacillus sp. FJAT-49736 TaxID=2833582 RepID=UPI001BC9B662|nr:FAD-binding oxidoreductase [Bacillus sp. FJAT-49736]MBS4172928.1 FAD-binding oxidoreductase [Bacillus sp. FJAT-49736]
MKKYIVIGAGILGAATAYHLAKAKKEVVIVDRKDIGQATDAAAGIVCPWLSQRRNKAWYQLAKGGAKYYPTLIKELEKDGETDTGYAKVGAISIHSDHDKLVTMEKRALKRKEEAPEMGDVTILSPKETKSKFPLLADGYGSVHVSGAARVDGRALRDALLNSAKKHSATMIHGEATLLSNGKQITGVNVEGNCIQADCVIVTAGAWGNQVLAPLGLDFQVTFQKAQILHLLLPGIETSKWPVVMPPTDQYLLAFNGGKIVAGATHENDTGFDTRVTAGGMQEILHKALELAPDLASATLLETRVGFRPFTPGFLPIIGKLPGFDGIFVANGLGASGLTMGPYIGSELAKLAMGLDTEIDVSLYDVEGAIKNK